MYVDGALMGVVDDFDGFSSHLKLAGGTHRIELKADGYEPYSGNVTVSVGKTTYPLEQPFFVLATQNPLAMEGTYPLPEAQLDRFFMKLKVAYPSAGSMST